MTSFEAGFFKYALERGFSESEAAHLLKQASEYPAAEQMFRSLPQQEEEQQHSPDELEALAELLKQKAIDSQLHLPDVHRVNL
jgi:hypothetical protein